MDKAITENHAQSGREIYQRISGVAELEYE